MATCCRMCVCMKGRVRLSIRPCSDTVTERTSRPLPAASASKPAQSKQTHLEQVWAHLLDDSTGICHPAPLQQVVHCMRSCLGLLLAAALGAAGCGGAAGTLVRYLKARGRGVERCACAAGRLPDHSAPGSPAPGPPTASTAAPIDPVGAG